MAEAHDGTSGETAGKAVAPQQDHSAPAPAVAVVRADRIPNPGFPPERLRVTDLDPKKVSHMDVGLYMAGSKPGVNA